MTLQQSLALLAKGTSLTREQMYDAMHTVMTGDATDAQIGALLMALHIKGESIDEIVGAASVMRELSHKVTVSGEHLVDTCGTGGDGADLFNVSTAGAFVVAAAGGRVAKHGNRSVSSSTGSADVLEAAGIDLSLSADQVTRAIDTLGVGFMFAPAHHSAMKHAIGPRKELAMRTIFNILGPMTNPAGVKRQVMGVFDAALCEPIAQALGHLGSEHVMVVHSHDGLDEISIANDTFVAEYNNGKLTTYTISPTDFGMIKQPLTGLDVDCANQSLALITSAFDKPGTDTAKKAFNIIALNAGAAIYVAGIASTLAEGVNMAEDAMASGGAKLKLNELVEFTQLATQ